MRCDYCGMRPRAWNTIQQNYRCCIDCWRVIFPGDPE